MLRRLCIRNYVLIDSLETEFPEGLVIITGQTGAGKSILLGAMSLLLGAKADASMIGESSENCVVEGEFIADAENEDMRHLLEDNDVDWNSGNLTIRRVVNPTGRSRSFVNDSPVPVQLLSSIASGLVDIHSQHQTALLSDSHFQLALIDRFAGDEDSLSAYRFHFRRYNELSRELERIEKDMDSARAEYDYNRSRLDKLESASLKENEIEELEAEQKQLANAEEIKECLCSAQDLLDSVRSGEDGTSVPALMREASRQLGRIEYVPGMSSLAERLESCRLEVEDIVSELAEVNSRTEVSGDRLAEVDERLSLLYSLLRAFSCTDIGGLIAARESLSAAVSGLAVSDERRGELATQIVSERESLEKTALALSQARKSAAAKLSVEIQDLLRRMELHDAVFDIGFAPGRMAHDGTDSVTYMFSSAGKAPEDIARCASGGEMSRIMLALKAVMARYANMPTMIFDEIDTGVSGSVADKMGSVICGMGRYMQVFAITHLPQVAAKGSAHYLVTRKTANGRPVSEMKRLSDDERVLEIARMLSGSELTDAAVANAKSLLSAE